MNPLNNKLIDHPSVLEETCGICISEMRWVEGEYLDLLGNHRTITVLHPKSHRHYFHEDCLDDWVLNRPVCPLCKEKVPLSERVKAIIKIQKNAFKYSSLPLHLKRDRSVILATIKQCAALFEAIPTEILTPDLILEMIVTNPSVYRLISAELKTNRLFIRMLVEKKPYFITSIDYHLIFDKEINLAAVRQNGMLLGIIEPECRNDFEITLAAVTQNGMALGFARDYFKKHPVIIQAAIRQNPEAARYAIQTRFLKENYRVILGNIAMISLFFFVYYELVKSSGKDEKELESLKILLITTIPLIIISTLHAQFKNRLYRNFLLA